MTPLTILYDGDCPFCANYVRLMRLRQRYAVTLIDARQDPAAVARYPGHDINTGMIVECDGTVYHGAEAVRLLSTASRLPGPLALRPVARAVYPALRGLRTITLRALGRPPISGDQRPS